MKSWNAQKTTLAKRLADGRRYASGKTIEVADLPNFLEAVIRPADRVCLEGDNQKQADVLAAALTDRRSRQDPRSSYGPVRCRAARASRCIREGHRAQARLFLFRPAVGAHRPDAVRRQNRAGGGAHLS